MWKIIAIQSGCVTVWGVFGEVLVEGAAGAAVRKGGGCPALGMAGSTAAAPQPRAEPVSGAGSASLETCLRKGKNTREE